MEIQWLFELFLGFHSLDICSLSPHELPLLFSLFNACNSSDASGLLLAALITLLIDLHSFANPMSAVMTLFPLLLKCPSNATSSFSKAALDHLQWHLQQGQLLPLSSVYVLLNYTKLWVHTHVHIHHWALHQAEIPLKIRSWMNCFAS